MIINVDCEYCRLDMKFKIVRRTSKWQPMEWKLVYNIYFWRKFDQLKNLLTNCTQIKFSWIEFKINDQIIFQHNHSMWIQTSNFTNNIYGIQSGVCDFMVIGHTIPNTIHSKYWRYTHIFRCMAKNYRWTNEMRRQSICSAINHLTAKQVSCIFYFLEYSRRLRSSVLTSIQNGISHIKLEFVQWFWNGYKILCFQ